MEATTRTQDEAAGASDDRIALVERWIGAFDRRWPTRDELAPLVTEDFRFVERPNLFRPGGSERDLELSLAGIEAGRALLAWQAYDVVDHVVDGDRVATQIRWTAELSSRAGDLPPGTSLAAWCSAHYTLRDGRIAQVVHHDCFEPPVPPAS